MNFSAVAKGAVDAPGQVSDGPVSDQALEQLGLSVHIMHLLMHHGAHGQLVVVVQCRPLLGEVVAEARQTHLVTQQAGQVQCCDAYGRHVLQRGGRKMSSAFSHILHSQWCVCCCSEKFQNCVCVGFI